MKIRNRSEGRRKMIHEVMDYANMSYGDRTYDIVLDKNVLDCFMSIPKDENKAATDAVRHVARILKPGGVFMYLSYAKASTRYPILGWEEDPDFCYRFTESMVSHLIVVLLVAFIYRHNEHFLIFIFLYSLTVFYCRNNTHDIT